MWKNVLVTLSVAALVLACSKTKPEVPVERKPQTSSVEKPKPEPEIKKTAAFSYEILEHNTPQEMDAGSRPVVVLKVKNTSDRSWPEDGAIKLGFYWTDEGGKKLKKMEGRSKVRSELPPGDRVVFQCGVKTPVESGQYYLVWDMVEDGIAWFGTKGAAPLRISVKVK